MTIYKLRFDRENYLNVFISPHEVEEKLGDPFLLTPSATEEENLNWSAFWQPLKIEFCDDSDSKNVTTPPDITWWHNNQLILNQKAYDVLSDALNPYGELLPLTCEGKPYWMFHVTARTRIDAVDTHNSERTIDPMGLVEIQKLSFKKNAIKDLLVFKTEYNNYLYNIYCTEAFKLLVEEAGIKGLVFSNDMTNSPF